MSSGHLPASIDATMHHVDSALTDRVPPGINATGSSSNAAPKVVELCNTSAQVVNTLTAHTHSTQNVNIARHATTTSLHIDSTPAFPQDTMAVTDLLARAGLKANTPRDINASSRGATSASLLPQAISTETTKTLTESEIALQEDDTSSLPPQPPKPTKPFPLMKLPAELRLNVYRHFCTDLTTTRQRAVADLSIYHEPDEWPDNDFSAYVNLTLTCKAVKREAKDLWEKEYASECCLYFWQLPKLYDAARALLKLGEPYASTQYLLRSRVSGEYERIHFTANEEEVTEFMASQPGFPPGYETFFWYHHLYDEAGEEVMHNGRVFRFRTYMGAPELRAKGATGYCSHIEYPRLNACEISVHRRDPLPQEEGTSDDPSHYVQMTGSFSGLFWGRYDAAASYGKMRLYEEILRRLPKVADRRWCPRDPVSLLKWWRFQRAQDSKWLALGGDISEGERETAGTYGLYEWMTLREIQSLSPDMRG
ncbi:hypothetical protein Q7P37_007148 [Cladosporium fusiforme]